MHEINQEAFLRQARQVHPRLLAESEQARLIEAATPYTPGLKDKIALKLGDWLIAVGYNLRKRSIYTNLTETHA